MSNEIKSITGDEALNELTTYILGEDWYCYSPIHAGQVNVVIVKEIKAKYDKYKKYCLGMGISCTALIFIILILLIRLCI